jgi:hypothetical protein
MVADRWIFAVSVPKLSWPSSAPRWRTVLEAFRLGARQSRRHADPQNGRPNETAHVFRSMKTARAATTSLMKDAAFQ